MLNLLRGEFYKLRKSRSFYVCSMVLIVFVMFIYGIFYLADTLEEQEAKQGEVSLVVTTEETEEIGILDVEQVIIGTVAGLITAVFACIFVVGEYGNGTIKNMIGKGYSREKIFLAKYLTTIAAAVIMFLLATFVTIAGGLLFWGTDSLDAEGVRNLSQYAGIQLLLEIALIGIITMVAEISRNLGVGIAISMGIISFSGIIFAGIDTLLEFLHLDLKATDYWIGTLVSACPTVGIESEFVKRVVIAFLFWTVAAVAAGIVHIKKADVK